MSIFLLKGTTLSFTRDDPNNKGYYHETSGKWVEASDVTVSATGNLQPYTGISNGEMQELVNSGYSATDVRIFYTKTKIQTLNQFTKVKPDQTVIDDRTYDAFSVKDWNIPSLSTSHYKVLLARKDLPSGV
jgi:hypothetical protein